MSFVLSLTDPVASASVFIFFSNVCYFPFDGVLCPVLVANVPKYKFKQVVVTSHTHFWKPRDIYGIDRCWLLWMLKWLYKFISLHFIVSQYLNC